MKVCKVQRAFAEGNHLNDRINGMWCDFQSPFKGEAQIMAQLVQSEAIGSPRKAYEES